MNMIKKNKEIKIRDAVEKDLEAIVRIYNYAIINTTATFDTRPKTVKSQEKWFYRHSQEYPIIVAEDDGGGVIGWASLSRWSDRCAYDKTAEISVYVEKDNQNIGIGNRLIVEIIKIARKNKLHVIIARIAGENEISIHIHKKYGFIYAGSLKEAGFKFNRYIDVNLMQLILD